MTQQERVTAAARCVDPASGPTWARCAALLFVLYAQPLQRFISLQSDSISEVDGELTIIVDEHLLPIPPPFDTPFRQLKSDAVGRRLYNQESPNLFPGRVPGQHRSVNSTRAGVVEIIGKLLPARNSTLRQLVTDCPPPVVAELLGYGDQVMTNHAKSAGSSWLSYAAIRQS